MCEAWNLDVDALIYRAWRGLARNTPLRLTSLRAILQASGSDIMASFLKQARQAKKSLDSEKNR